ncbi:hypothetical protein L2E82_37806 [Cichorium intybus]|uniref:Uncharacterized protein n=1 Tax=Cichorium intybus TaxID=13427 RepID=A0ACB9AF09_CICIN|nr:hypothetical protein L2E82_37806 [Cichorium intybus]
MAEASSQRTEAISIRVLKNQSANLVLRNDLKLYPQPIVSLVECLKRSVLGYALTYTPSIPATLVHRAHYTSNALFDTNNHVKSVFYEAIDSKGKTKKVQLTKEKFTEVVHLPVYNSKEMVVPFAEQLVDMFNEMGYEPQLEKISTFKKNQLPDLWRYFFSIFLRCLSGRTSGLDSASVAFQSLLYGIYYDVKVDFTSILWADFCSHINHSLKGTEISNARFWAIVVHAHYQQAGYVSMDCDEVNAYRNTLVVPYPVREITQAVPAKAQLKAKGKKKVTGGPSGPKKVEKKRKGSEQTTPKRKQSKGSRKLTIVDESSESNKTPFTIQEEEEEHHDTRPPSPLQTTRSPTPPHITRPPLPSQTTRPPSPPKITRPPTPPHITTPPPPPPTTAQQTTTIHTTSSYVPPKSTSTKIPPISSSSEPFLNIPSYGLDTLLPDYPFQDDIDFEASISSKTPVN